MYGTKANAAALALLLALTACGGGGGASATASSAGNSSMSASSGSPATAPTPTPGSDSGNPSAGTPAAAAAWTADADFVVNGSSSADVQVMPAVARLQDGGFVVVWSAAPGDSVTLRRYDLHGMPTGAESVLDGGNAGVHPAVVALPDGGFAVAWFQFPGFVPGPNGTDSGVVNVMVQRFDANGIPSLPATLAGKTWGKRYLGPDPTRAAPLRPMLVPIANGGFATVWSGAADAVSALQIHAALFDVHGASSGQKALALPVAVTAVPLSDGGFLTAGFDTRYTGGSPIVAQRYDANANAVGASFNLGGSSRTDYGVSSFVLKDGSPALLYASVDPIGGNTQQVHYTLVRLSAADGSRVRSLAVGDRLLSTLSSAVPEGAALDDGGFVVMSSLIKPGVQPPVTHVLLQRFDASGTPTGQSSFESALVDGTAQPVQEPAGIAGAVENSVVVVTRASDAGGATKVVALHR